MQTLRHVAALAAIFSLALSGADWPTQSGGPQRDAWARSEKIITKDNVGSLNLLYKYQSDNEARGGNSLSTPIISGMLITYRGFKEMLVFAGSGGNVYSVDADLNRLLWKRHFDVKGGEAPAATPECPGGLTTSVVMPGSSSAGFKAPAKPVEKDMKQSPKEKARQEAENKLASGFGRLGGMFTVSSDGYLHALNSSTGEDLLPATPFVPPHSNLSSLNVMNNIVYAATTHRCGGKPNALYAIDLLDDHKKVEKYEVKDGEISGIGGTAIGSDGTVYLQVTPGKTRNADKNGDSVVALTPDLKLKDYFKMTESRASAGGITPAVVSWKDKELVIAGGSDGRIYLLDSASLGGPDHKRPLFETEAIVTNPGGGMRGAFASWFESDSQTRWIYAPIWGAAGAKDGDVATGAVVAFQLSDEKGSPILKPGWVSPDILAPAAPATANGIVFVLSSGDSTRPAVLHFLDGATGKELHSTGNLATTYSSGGVAVANGRVYFTTHDNAVYCLGFSKLNPQLTDQ